MDGDPSSYVERPTDGTYRIPYRYGSMIHSAEEWIVKKHTKLIRKRKCKVSTSDGHLRVSYYYFVLHQHALRLEPNTDYDLYEDAKKHHMDTSA